MQRDLYDTDHEQFRSAVREFIAREVSPNRERWDHDGLVDRTAWLAAGAQGLLGTHAPVELGGGGTYDYRYVHTAHRSLPAPGFSHLMDRLPRERLFIAATSLASAQAAFDRTRAYARERTAFGRRVDDFQNSRFVLAEIATELDLAWAYVDRSIQPLNGGELTAVDAAKAKWWVSDLQQRVVDRCLQLHGDYGYVLE
jgi:alkylation response protein AidB-like acyl-CoA dehydrogenase